jgi:hypothetical protein
VTPSIPNVSTEITSMTVVDVGAAQSARHRRRARSTMTGAVYRVQPDGLWDELWTAKDDAPYDVAIEADGAVLVATGAKGKLFRLSGDPVSAVLVTRVPAQQATMIARAAIARSSRRQSRAADVGVVSARDARHLRVRRERRASRLDVGRGGVARHGTGRQQRSRSSRAPATPGRPTKRGASGARRTQMPKARRSRAPKRDTCSGRPC